ncbi:hypothetical protein HQ520_01890 [bacterium]|nr:hypothetical protein [bacterium]
MSFQNPALSHLPPEELIKYCLFCGERITGPSCSCGAVFRYRKSPFLWLTLPYGLGCCRFFQSRRNDDPKRGLSESRTYEFRFGTNFKNWLRSLATEGYHASEH